MTQRLRIRFCKQDDLRWISHRDLVRTLERLFRRAELKLRMSEGYHPKAKMSFPSALGLGICSTDEVMELELAEGLPLEELRQRLEAQAPAGLVFSAIEEVPATQRKAQVQRMVYEFPVPAQRRGQVEQAIRQLMAQPSYPVKRPGRRAPLDLRATLERLELRGGVVRLQIAETEAARVRPREVLEALELSDLEAGGGYLTRTRVELTS